jgi:hypothetical protein
VPSWTRLGCDSRRSCRWWRSCRCNRRSRSRCRCYSRSRCRRWAGLRAVSPTGAQIVHADSTAPEDHFATAPDCRVGDWGLRRVGRPVATQLSVPGSYPPGVQIDANAPESAPDGHFAASPHCGVRVSDRNGIRMKQAVVAQERRAIKVLNLRKPDWPVDFFCIGK